MVLVLSDSPRIQRYSESATKQAFVNEILEVFRCGSPRKQRKLWGLVPLMLLGAIAEWVTLSTVVLFLVVLSDADPTARMSLMGGILNIDVGGATNSGIWWITGLFLLAVFISMATRLMLTRAMSRFSFEVGRDLGIEMFRRVLYQPFRYHARHNSSEVLGAVNKAHGVATTVVLPTVQILTSIVLASAILLALLWVNALVAIAAGGALVLLYWIASRITVNVLARNSEVVARAHTLRMKIVQEGVGGIRDILLEGAQELFLRQFRSVETDFRDTQAKNAYISQFPRVIIEALGIATIALLAVWLSTTENSTLTHAIPTLGALALGAQRLLPQVHQIYSNIATIRGGRGMLRDLLTVLRLPIPETYSHGAVSDSAGQWKRIELRNVSFGYDKDRPLVLENFDLEVERGLSIGIVGETGCGKSTLLDLIMGLLKPSSGSIEVDGNSISEGRVDFWHRRIGHVSQHIFLLDESFARNIAFSDDRMDRERLQKVISVADLDRLIETSKDGCSTPVGERGARLSGGERQRLGIARALYRETDVLVMDEATSALDDSTSVRIMKNIKREFPNLTVIMATHNPRMLEFCDAIYCIEQGRLARSIRK